MKNFKFKKLSPSDTLYIEGGYVTNRVYIMNMQWLNSVPSRSNMQLRNRMKKTAVEIMSKRLRNEEVSSLPISELVDGVDLREFNEVPLAEFSPLEGNYKGKAHLRDTVAFHVSRKVAIDVEFYAALTWDKDTKIHVKDGTDPVVLTKDGKIVCMIAPLNSNYLNKV